MTLLPSALKSREEPKTFAVVPLVMVTCKPVGVYAV
jgi:hypothetical protein